MPDSTPSLDELIRQVRDSAPDDPLAQLAAAARLRDDLAEQADALLGHFVDQARRGGASWSQIGDALGITKQAAQQRHTQQAPAKSDLLQDLSRFTERARTSIREAQAASTRLGHSYVSTEHLLLGLLAVPEGIAGRILAEHEITTERVDAFITDLVGTSATTGGVVGAFTPRAASCLVKSLTEALTMGHNYIGTEHILLGLYGEKQGLAAKLLRDAGLPKKDAQARVIQLLTAIRPGP
jgi:hypothetical protein